MLRSRLALLLLAAVPAAAQQIDDPANLMGERVAAPALADTLPINHGAPALEQLLRKLRTRASLMLIIAHPDDEDGGLLTYESRGQGARVAMLTLTRGEGGQNLMSADFNDALGLIRTQELLAADRYMGVDQFFGTEVDFGFSKTKEETLKQWGHDRVLYDAVRAVRLYRPLVLASVFVGGVTDGHGQHQVSGEIAQEVFVAAADPKVFPEMGLPPWAPLKVYARTPFAPVTAKGMFDYATGRFSPTKFHNYVTGVEIDHEPAATVTIHEGAKPAIAAFNGMSFVQFARQGLAMQKSQIGNGVRVPPAGDYDVGYTRMGSRLGKNFAAGPPTESGLFDGVDTSLAGIAALSPDAPREPACRARSGRCQGGRRAKGVRPRKAGGGRARAPRRPEAVGRSHREHRKVLGCRTRQVQRPARAEGKARADERRAGACLRAHRQGRSERCGGGCRPARLACARDDPQHHRATAAYEIAHMAKRRQAMERRRRRTARRLAAGFRVDLGQDRSAAHQALLRTDEHRTAVLRRQHPRPAQRTGHPARLQCHLRHRRSGPVASSRCDARLRSGRTARRAGSLGRPAGVGRAQPTARHPSSRASAKSPCTPASQAETRPARSPSKSPPAGPPHPPRPPSRESRRTASASP